jgi:hypothetical protein
LASWADSLPRVGRNFCPALFTNAAEGHHVAGLAIRPLNTDISVDCFPARARGSSRTPQRIQDDLPASTYLFTKRPKSKESKAPAEGNSAENDSPPNAEV